MNRSISRGRAQTLLSREMADGRARHLLAAFQNMGAGGERDVINANSEQAVREPRSELAPAGLRRGDTDDALVLCTGWRLPAAQNAPAVDKGQVLELQGWHIGVGTDDFSDLGVRAACARPFEDGRSTRRSGRRKPAGRAWPRKRGRQPPPAATGGHETVDSNR